MAPLAEGEQHEHVGRQRRRRLEPQQRQQGDGGEPPPFGPPGAHEAQQPEQRGEGQRHMQRMFEAAERQPDQVEGERRGDADGEQPGGGQPPDLDPGLLGDRVEQQRRRPGRRQCQQQRRELPERQRRQGGQQQRPEDRGGGRGRLPRVQPIGPAEDVLRQRQMGVGRIQRIGEGPAVAGQDAPQQRQRHQADGGENGRPGPGGGRRGRGDWAGGTGQRGHHGLLGHAVATMGGGGAARPWAEPGSRDRALAAMPLQKSNRLNTGVGRARITAITGCQMRGM